jgi:dipeptidyl aminopeptidase/acylaminoacyl peptidase
LWDSTSQAVYLPSVDGIWRIGIADTAAVRVSSVGREIVDVISTTGGQRLWSPDGESLFAIARDTAKERSVLYRISLSDGSASEVNAVDAHYGTRTSHPIGSANGPIAFLLREDATHPPDVWMLSGRGTLQQITRLNPELASERFGKSRLVRWNAPDGVMHRGTVLLPPDYDGTHTYPLVVWVYPTFNGSEYVNVFGASHFAPFNLQLLTTAGYVVLFPDCATRIGSPMKDIVDTVMPGVDRVIQLGIADSARLAVMGWSYGGYGVLSLMVQTPRFRAAVMSAAITDPISFYGALRRDGISGGVQHMESGQGKMGGPPWSVPEVYVANTPIFHLNRVETPLLAQAGTADILPSLAQAQEVFVGLRRLGKEVTLLEYTGEGHFMQSRSNLVDFWRRVLRFLDEKLNGTGAPRHYYPTREPDP